MGHDVEFNSSHNNRKFVFLGGELKLLPRVLCRKLCFFLWDLRKWGLVSSEKRQAQGSLLSEVSAVVVDPEIMTGAVRAWSSNQHLQQHLGPCENCTTSGLAPESAFSQDVRCPVCTVEEDLVQRISYRVETGLWSPATDIAEFHCLRCVGFSFVHFLSSVTLEVVSSTESSEEGLVRAWNQRARSEDCCFLYSDHFHFPTIPRCFFVHFSAPSAHFR